MVDLVNSIFFKLTNSLKIWFEIPLLGGTQNIFCLLLPDFH